MLQLSLKLDHVMQTTNDIFVNPSAIKTKYAGKLVDDTEQVSGKAKPLGVKREQTPHNYRYRKNQKFQFWVIFTLVNL